MRSERPGACFRREKDRRKEMDRERDSVCVCVWKRDGQTGGWKKDELRERQRETTETRRKADAMCE